MTYAEGAKAAETVGLGERLLKLLPSRRKPAPERGAAQTWRWPLLGQLIVGQSLGSLAFLAILASICGTGVLYLLNSEAQKVGEKSYSVGEAVLFVGLLVVYSGSQSRLIRRAALAIEAALDKKRQRVVADILTLSLQDVEAVGLDRIRGEIAVHYGTLSQTLVPLISGVESLILLAFMFAYVLTLSVFAGVLTALVVGLTVAWYLNRNKQMESELAAAAAADGRYRVLTNALARGAKELQLSLGRRVGLEAELRASSEALARGRSTAAGHFAELIATGTTVSYLMAGAVVFVMPILTGGGSDISQIVVAIIFLLGPIGSVVQTAQQLATAQFALGAIQDFETEVAGYRNRRNGSDPGQGETQGGATAPPAFEEIVLDEVRYAHTGRQGFAIEEINLTLKRGEIVFLTVGNGTGKTTLLRVLCGLYPRAGGDLRLNGASLSALPPQSYREQFAAVFTDFHLFDRPLGLDEAGLVTFESWLVRLGIRDKLGADLNEVNGEALSTGQRKRVALALALAEGRSILLLDEWAADQDPETRARFYQEILPSLKADGITIFAVTHDEAYFKYCDRRLHMIEGRLVEGVPE